MHSWHVCLSIYSYVGVYMYLCTTDLHNCHEDLPVQMHKSICSHFTLITDDDEKN